MTNEAKSLVRKCIVHWENMVKGTEIPVANTKTCPLCGKYAECTYCPVAKKVHQDGCTGTPWEELNDHVSQQHFNALAKNGFTITCPTCLRLAKKEIRFLKRLIPVK